MRSLNEVMKRTNYRHQHLSHYDRFESRMSEIFELVFNSDFMEEKEKEDRGKMKSKENMDDFDENLVNTFANLAGGKEPSEDNKPK